MPRGGRWSLIPGYGLHDGYGANLPQVASAHLLRLLVPAQAPLMTPTLALALTLALHHHTLIRWDDSTRHGRDHLPVRAEAYPDLGLEHNYCRNDPSIASFGFESYPRRLYDGLHAWVPGIARTSRYRVTTPAYLQTRTAPWRGMSKVPAWRRRSTAGASPPQPHGRATHSEGPAARSKQHEASTASSKQARSRANLPCYIPPAAGGSLGPSAHSTQA